MPEAPPPSDKPPRQPTPKRPAALPVITEGRRFILIVLLVAGFAFCSLLCLVALAFFGKDPPGPLQSKLADVSVYICMVCVGALVGLLGGRAAAPDRLEIGEKK